MNLNGRPLVQANGVGLDSAAVLVGFKRQGLRPDAILFADTGGERDETYRYRAALDECLQAWGFPAVTVVRYDPQDFKHYPPYHTLEENCLTNGTLPSLAFGYHMKSCSIKWKQAPQNKWCDGWEPARACWARGERVVKVIGYDAGPKDARRRNHAGDVADPEYEYWYPLAEWGWDRARCVAEVVAEGMPGFDPEYLARTFLPPSHADSLRNRPPQWIARGGVPMKSSCFFCPAMQTWEVAALPPDKLRRIVLIEARAKPRLQSIEGLWGRGCKGTRGGQRRPGMMTDYIREQGLLSGEEIDRIIAEAPKELLDRQQAFANGKEIPNWPEFFEELNEVRGAGFCCASMDEEE